MADQVQGQPGADRAVGRPGPAARMTGGGEAGSRPRPSVLIPPVTGTPTGPAGRAPASAPPSRGAAGYPGQQASAAPSQAPAPPRPTDRGWPAGPPEAAPGTTPPPTQAQQAPPPGQAAGGSAGRGRAARVARSAVQPTLGPRSARLYVTHVDPWSVMKQAFLLSLAIAIVLLVASATLWFALESAGVIEAITRTATDVGGSSGASVGAFLGFGKVMGVALVLAAIESVLVTALATLFAFLYNLAVGIGGGLEITLSEED